MYGKLKSALLAAMFVGLGGACALGGDLAGGATEVQNQSDGSSGVYYIFNSDTSAAGDTVQNDNSMAPVVGIGTAAGNGTEYVFGASAGAAGTYTHSEGKVNATINTLELRNNILTLTHSDKLNKEGTSLTLTNLDATRGGTINLTDSVSTAADRYNVLTVDNLNANGAHNNATNINVGANSLLHVKNAAVLGDASNTGRQVNFNLGNASDAGRLQFDNGMTLRNGTISGNGYVKGDVTLDGRLGIMAQAIVNASGADQTYDGDLTIGANGGQVIVGYNGVTKESNLDVTGTLAVRDGTANGSFVAIAGTDSTTRGTLTANDLELTNNGTVNVSQYGKLVVDHTNSAHVTTIGQGYVNVGQYGEAEFANKVVLNNTSAITADQGKVTFGDVVSMGANARLNILNGGTIDISKNTVINSGTVFVSGAGNSLIVGNGLVLDSVGAISYDGMAGPNELSVLRTDKGAVGDLSIARDRTIDFSSVTSSTLNVGELGILGTVNGNLYTGAFPGGAQINALSFAVASGADAASRNDVTTTVERAAVIQGKFSTAGAENYLRGLKVNNGGELAADITGLQGGNAVINVGETGVRAANVIVNNGTLSSDATAGNTLTLNNVHATRESDLVFGGTGNVVKGTVIASGGGGFGIHVDGDVDLEENGSILRGDSFSQTGGTFQASNGIGQYLDVVGTQVSTVAGPNSVFASSANFTKGVSFSDRSTLRADANQTIELKGDAAAGTNLSMANGTLLDLTGGDIDMNDFDNVYLGGRIRLGFVGGQTTMANTIGSHRTVGNLRNIELTKEFVAGYRNTLGTIGDYIWYDNTVTGTPAYDYHVIKNVFGDFAFESLEGDGAWLDSVNAKNVADVAGVRNSLRYHWGDKAVSWGFAHNVSQVAQNMLNPAAGAYVHPAGNAAGSLNYSILEAYALGGPGTAFVSGDTSGYIDRALLNAYTGAAATGVVFTAQDVTREIINTLHARVADVRSAQNAVANAIITSDGALASMSVAEALNNQYLNRIWAGGLGMWNHANGRKGHTGYEYDGSGLILGYDRAFGSVIGGLSVAYMKGDYEDKSATKHDSEIKNYAVDAYLTYNACSGFFATVMGGYNYSDNDIRERRGGNWAEEDYHTNTWHVGGKVGYDFAASDRLTLSPAVGANFYYSRSNEHDVNLNNQAIMKYGDMKNHNVEIPVEVRAAYNITLSDDQDLTLMANGGYAYNINDHGVNGDVTLKGMGGVVPMRAIGRKLGHHSWNAGAGVKYRSGGWDVGVKYDYYGRGKSDNHRVMGTVGYSF